MKTITVVIKTYSGTRISWRRTTDPQVADDHIAWATRLHPGLRVIRTETDEEVAS